MRWFIYAMAAADVLSFSSITSASPVSVPVENYSFEVDVPTLGASDVNGERYTQNTPTTAWTAVDSNNQVTGVADPSNDQYTGTGQDNMQGNLPGTGDGVQYGYINLAAGGSGAMTYSGYSLGNFVGGETYQLNVAIGQRKDVSAGLYTITLLDSGVPVGIPVSGLATTDTFTDLIYAYTPLTNGGPIGIEIIATSNSTEFEQDNFDNVRLTVVPEPASLGLLAVAALGMSRRRRCR